MNEAEYIERVVRALEKVPEKKLLIIDLVNQIPIVNGDLDAVEVSNRQVEINLAIAEAKAYGTHTIMSVEALFRSGGGEDT